MIQCFLVVETGETKEEEYNCPCGCNTVQKRTVYAYRRTDTGETKFLMWPGQVGGFPVGAMWFAEMWSHEGKYMDWDNDSGKHLHVLTPGGPWDIDSRCSNCGSKDDRLHRCWIRHGEPPNVTVDKNGHTCSAGGGSIQAGNYHGFLQNGCLT